VQYPSLPSEPRARRFARAPALLLAALVTLAASSLPGHAEVDKGSAAGCPLPAPATSTQDQREALRASVESYLRCAAPSENAASGGGWMFELTPYLWLPAVSGDAAVTGSPPANPDDSFVDVSGDFDFGMLLLFDARKDRWGFFVDLMYVSTSPDATTPGPLFSGFELTSKGLMVETAVAYRVADSKCCSADVFAGARLWFLDNELRFDPGLISEAVFSQDKNWVDPIVGARARVALSEKWFLLFLADLGGFGAGSDFTWQAFAGAGYQISKTWSVKFGYRALGIDFEDGGFVYDVTLQGFILGFGIRF